MKKFLITCFLGLTVATASAAEKKRHLLVFVGEGNLSGVRPVKTVMPALKKEHPLSKNEFQVVQFLEGYLPTTALDKDWKADDPKKSKKVRRPGNMYPKLLNSVKRVTGKKEYDTMTLFWYQGANDVRENRVKEYTKSVKRIVTRLEKDLDQGKMNVVITGLTDSKKDMKRYSDWEEIRKQQKALGGNKQWSFISTDELNGPGDKARLTNKGFKELGAAYTEKALTIIGSAK